MSKTTILFTVGILITLVIILSPYASQAKADATICSGTLSSTGNPYGDLVVPSGATCLLLPGVFVDGDVDVESGGFLSTFLGGVTIDGDVHAEGAFIVSITCSTVTGDVDIDGTTSFSRVTGSTVGGDVKIENSATSIVVGPSLNFALCPGGNMIDGDVELEDNTTNFPANVASNTIGGDLECEGNNFAPTLGPGISNTVSGDKEGQCALL